jgi:hypothetical protein
MAAITHSAHPKKLLSTRASHLPFSRKGIVVGKRAPLAQVHMLVLCVPIKIGIVLVACFVLFLLVIVCGYIFVC